MLAMLQMIVIWPIHYALSEALIVVAAIFAIARIWHLNRWFAIGLAVVALAGLVGAIRIVGGMTGDIVILHDFLSRYGALFGLGCMVGALQGWQNPLPLILGLAAATMAMALPIAGPPIMAILLLGGAAFAYRGAPDTKLLAAISFGSLVLAPFASAPFRPNDLAVAWHMFHTLVAAWFVLVGVFVATSLAPRREAALS